MERALERNRLQEQALIILVVQEVHLGEHEHALGANMVPRVPTVVDGSRAGGQAESEERDAPTVGIFALLASLFIEDSLPTASNVRLLIPLVHLFTLIILNGFICVWLGHIFVFITLEY